jgi:D-alanyl-D-alanine carboxypeptidase/D-alanyl-D-alanine-endopeptidase (penicillin-binding protein 4)
MLSSNHDPFKDNPPIQADETMIALFPLRQLLCVWLLCQAIAVTAGELPAPVAQALKAAEIPRSAVAIVVQAVDSARPKWAINADQAMNPASTMKLLTTFAALDILGPAYTWQTQAFINGPLENGVLKGDLYLQGSGDPKLTYEHFARWLREMRQRGLREIRGDLVLDRHAFALAASDAEQFDHEIMRPYNVLPDALLLNFNAISVQLLPQTGQMPRLAIEPPVGNLELVNQLRSDDHAACGDWREGLRSEVLTSDAVNRLVLSGTYPLGCGEQRWHIALADHSRFVLGIFRSLWAELGGKFGGNSEGNVRESAVPPDARLFAVSPSPTLGDIVRDINKYSNNVMARQLFLTLGLEAGHRPARPEDGAAAIQDWLNRRSLKMPELILENGAGLSRQERISAASLGRLLQAAWRSAVMPEFMASLPIAGIDGTMKKRVQGQGVVGQAHIKTGSLDGVKSMAGYVLDQQGHRWIVVCLVNHPRAALAAPAMDALLQSVWQRGG